MDDDVTDAIKLTEKCK